MDKIYNWGIYLDGGHISTISTVGPRNSKGEFTLEEVTELLRLFEEVPHPVLSSDKSTAVYQVQEFENQLKELLYGTQGTTR